jgi:hypothetical protein
MSAHFWVAQLRFARSEFARCLEGVSEEEARRRVEDLNCISWMVGHLANQENHYWVIMAQGRQLFPELNDLTGFRKPASSPPLQEMWSAWKTITGIADDYLDAITVEQMKEHFQWQGETLHENIGTMLMRNTYHYWFHTGQALIVRKLLGHSNLPEFVGDMSRAAYQ